MGVSREVMRRQIEMLGSVEGVAMNPQALVEDITIMAQSFPEEPEFLLACASTLRALQSLVRGEVTEAKLKYSFEGWSSYHYQHKVAQGQRADCRIVFMRTRAGIEVLGFGHRNVPEDVYHRLGSAQRL